MINSRVYQQVESSLEVLSSSLDAKGLCIALSGGVDSVVLLHLCREYANKHNVILQAVYVNHGLSQHATQWQQFCQSLCETLNVPFVAKQVSITRKTRTSLEAQAREARYQALDDAAKAGFAIVLGQHADDQVETFLLRLKRGSGLLGLGAMRATTQLASGRYCIRPLLAVSRNDIEAFARQFGLEHITDESNADDAFDRNFLRNQVIPLLTSRFNGFVANTLRSIDILQRQQTIIDEVSEEDLQKCRCRMALNITALQQLSFARRDNVIRLWLSKQGIEMPSQKQLDEIVQQAFSSRQDSQLEIRFKQGAVRRYRDALYWVTENSQKHDIETVNLNELSGQSTPVALQTGKGVRKPFTDEIVSIRYGRLKDKIKPQGKPGSNTLKHWLKDLYIPSWERDSIAVVYYNDTPVAVNGLFVSAEHAEDNGIIWVVKDD
ncbi:tRNA lysidine(34) synthetase TilS [Pseudoalteromonas sp. OF7H-1]|uniref:tRNA lysidine(34) synthetase TilS n=1 Tax=Pseudoalteromonas sp. OF7H-1 TaxID=2917755 RepID=UPI001EF65F24|nr:tRNA lysidine(34) synthetase TilS [Pseudoalteromonas sp. OF7H-1]MCG7540471.1 tRNA lysidine(34) synthetase TilS [Pseudoalteromonas sp. OF7H-1]